MMGIPLRKHVSMDKMDARYAMPNVNGKLALPKSVAI